MSTFKPISFDSNQPFGSLATFTENQSEYLDEQKKIAFETLEKLFSSLAYKKEVFPLEESDLVKNHYIPVLINISEELKLETSRIDSLIANISKVGGAALAQINPPSPFYEIVIKEGEDEYLGQILTRYVKGSKKLFPQNKKIIIESKKVSPSALFALQRFQNLRPHPKTKNLEINFSFDALCELIVFAQEWDLKPLLKELRELDALITEKKDQNKFEKAKQNNNLEIINQALQTDKKGKGVNSFYLIEDYQENNHVQPFGCFHCSQVVFCEPSCSSVPSEWFNEETPYDSMILFTKACAKLSLDTQNRFFSHIRQFFSPSNPKTMALPEDIEHLFARTLPFYLRAFPIKKRERYRLIANIMRIAQKEFSNLRKDDQLQLIHNTYFQGKIQLGYLQKETFIPKKEASPLEILAIESSGLIPFDHLDKGLETPESIIERFKTGIHYSLSPLIKSACDKAHEVLKQEEGSKTLSHLLIPFLINPQAKSYLEKMPLNLDLEKLNEEEIKALFYLELEKGTAFSKAVQKILKDSPHLPLILNQFEINASDAFKKSLKSTYSEILFSLASEKICDKIFVRNFFNKINPSYENFKNINYEDNDWLNINNSTIEKLQEFLYSLNTLFLIEKIGLTYEVLQLLRTMEETFPFLQVKNKIHSFMQTFFPREYEPSLKDALKAFMTEVAERKDAFFSQALAKKYPLREETIVGTSLILKNEKISEWLSENLPCLSPSLLFSYFDKGYHFDYATQILPLREALAEKVRNPQDRQKIDDFFSCIFKVFFSTPDRKKEKKTTLSAYEKIDLIPLDFIEIFLDDKIFNSLQPLKTLLINLIDRYRKAPQKAEDFLSQFVKQKEYQNFTFRIFVFTYTLGFPARFKFKPGQDSCFIFLNKLLQTPDVEEWFKKEDAFSIREALEEALAKNSSCLTELLAIEGIGTRMNLGALSSQFLESALRFLVKNESCSLNEFQTRVKQFYLDDDEVNKIKIALQDPKNHFLVQPKKLEAAVDWLLRNIDKLFPKGAAIKRAKALRSSCWIQ